MTLNEMSCKELVELITDYFEERLSDTEQERFQAHLVTCLGCRTYLEQMRQTVKLLGWLTAERIAPDMQQTLLEVFRDWKNSPEGSSAQDP